MKKLKLDNNLMLDIISYGGFSNQITDDYFSNNQVYSKLLEEQSKYNSGALVTYGDKHVFNLDKALTINTNNIYIRKDLSLSEVIFFYEKARIKKEGLIESNLSDYTYIKQYFLNTSLCCGIDKDGRYILITKNKRVLDSVAINRIKDNTETEMYYFIPTTVGAIDYSVGKTDTM